MPSTHGYNPIKCATGGECGEAPDHPIHFHGESVRLEPNYPNVAIYMSRMITGHSIEPGKERDVLWSFVDVIRYLAQTDPAGLKEVMDFIKPPQPVLAGVTVISAEGSFRGTLNSDDSISIDSHLESDYEDRNGYPEE